MILGFSVVIILIIIQTYYIKSLLHKVDYEPAALIKPPKELLKAWTKKHPRKKPIINDDNSAWKKENNLE